MFTVLSNTRNSNLYIITALGIALVVFLTLAVVPSIAAPKPAVIPVTGSQNGYVEFLRGEKAMYANLVGLGESLSAYRAGEKAVYGKAVDSSSVLSTYHLGEQATYTNSINLGNALSTWRSGEKAIVRSDAALESALSAWRQGEKESK